ncbi:hypothetical protein HPP92_026649 [Vanilla planifolia]|uniref:Uncharacterized protein n=1 Tax=Vanilla planifolia TaxID=51239 RepID=A0A835U8Y4_VANPL|nr:hypothetical protein HPP92_026866 [Vanilla planifolia]KAG0450619.1 hypothetical protein HPP92_026649 [Vanilla planifolia]
MRQSSNRPTQQCYKQKEPGPSLASGLDLSSREELRCGFEGPAFVSNSERSPWASKATGKVVIGDIKESNKCKHFTIRGYVAGVRKRDAKSCWPFMHRGCTMLESADLFPPLCVANFKWWGCHDCVNEMISTTPQMTTEGSMCIQSQVMKNNNNALLENVAETSQQEAIKVFSRLPLISEEHYGEGRLTAEYCSINFSKHEKEGNEDPLRNIMKDEDVRPESMKAAKKSGIDVTKAQRKSMKHYNMVGKDDVLYADEAHTLGHGTCDMRSCGASFCDTKGMGGWPEMEDDMENMHSRKIRKVRLLEDIIRNTEQHMAENNRSLAGDRICVEHDLSWRQDTHKRKVLLLNHTSDVYPRNVALRSARCTSQIQNPLNEDENKGEAVPHANKRDHHVPQRNSLKFVERLDTYEDLSNEGKGPSLMHWLKSVSRKVNADKGEATNQRRKVFVSNFSADLSVGNDQNLHIKDCDPLECRLEPTSRQIQALVPRDSGLPKNILGREGTKSKNYRYKNITTKGIVILDKKQQCRMENSDTTGKNAVLHDVRNKRPISGRGKSYQAQKVEDVQPSPDATEVDVARRGAS